MEGAAVWSTRILCSLENFFGLKQKSNSLKFIPKGRKLLVVRLCVSNLLSAQRNFWGYPRIPQAGTARSELLVGGKESLRMVLTGNGYRPLHLKLVKKKLAVCVSVSTRNNFYWNSPPSEFVPRCSSCCRCSGNASTLNCWCGPPSNPFAISPFPRLRVRWNNQRQVSNRKRYFWAMRPYWWCWRSACPCRCATLNRYPVSPVVWDTFPPNGNKEHLL